MLVCLCAEIHMQAGRCHIDHASTNLKEPSSIVGRKDTRGTDGGESC